MVYHGVNKNIKQHKIDNNTFFLSIQLWAIHYNLTYIHIENSYLKL